MKIRRVEKSRASQARMGVPGRDSTNVWTTGPPAASISSAMYGPEIEVSETDIFEKERVPLLAYNDGQGMSLSAYNYIHANH